jgi:hypothetical protein
MPRIETPSWSRPVVSAHAAAHAHARQLVAELTRVREANRALSEERRMLLESCRRGQAEMRVAIQHYVTTLKSGGVPPERALALLKSAMEDGLGGVGFDRARDEELLQDGVRWGIQAYYAA